MTTDAADMAVIAADDATRRCGTTDPREQPLDTAAAGEWWRPLRKYFDLDPGAAGRARRRGLYQPGPAKTGLGSTPWRDLVTQGFPSMNNDSGDSRRTGAAKLVTCRVDRAG